MQDMALRAGRRLQDVAVAWHARGDRRPDSRQQLADLRRQRMTCSATLSSDYQVQDWTARQAVSPSGRFRVIEETQPRAGLFTGDGIRWDVAWGLLAGIAALLVLVLLIQVVGIGVGNRSVARLNSKIEAVAQKNERMQAELAYQSEDVNVCTEAVKLNMVASDRARTVWLTAPENAILTVMESPKDPADPPGNRLASAQGD